MGLMEKAVVSGRKVGVMCEVLYQGVDKEGEVECGVATHSRWLV